MKKKKTKYFKLKTEFNPGTQKYEPILPAKKRKEKFDRRIEIKDLIMIIISLILLTGFIWILTKV